MSFPSAGSWSPDAVRRHFLCSHDSARVRPSLRIIFLLHGVVRHVRGEMRLISVIGLQRAVLLLRTTDSTAYTAVDDSFNRRSVQSDTAAGNESRACLKQHSLAFLDIPRSCTMRNMCAERSCEENNRLNGESASNERTCVAAKQH